jgi:hypothetical protein
MNKAQIKYVVMTLSLMYWKVAFDSKYSKLPLLFLGNTYSLLKRYCVFAIMNNNMNNYRPRVR